MPSISRTENLQVCKKLNFGCFENMKKCLASVFWAIKKTLKQDGCKATLHFSYYNIWWRLFLLDTCFSSTNTKSLWKKMNQWNISKTLCKTLLFCDLQIYYKYISRSTYYIYRHGYRAFWQGGGNIIWIRGGQMSSKITNPHPSCRWGEGGKCHAYKHTEA